MKKLSRFVPLLFFILTAGVTISCRHTPLLKENLPEAISLDSLKSRVSEWAWGQSAVLGISPPDSLLLYIDELRRISAERELYQELCTALKARYFYYRSRGDFAETYRTLLEQVSAARKTNNDFLIVDALYLTGRLLSMNGNILEGLDYFLQVAEMNPPDPSLRVTLFYALAQQYTTIHQREFAQQYYELAEAETLKPDYNNDGMIGWVKFGKGNTYLDMSDHIVYNFAPLTPSRKDSLTTAILLWRDATQYVENHNFYLQMALGYALLGDFEKAKASEAKAIELGMLSQERMSFVHYYSALIRYIQRRFSDAIDFGQKGLEVSLANRNYADASYNLNVLYHAAQRTGDDAKAVQYIEQRSALKDSMFVKEQQEQVIANQVKFDTKLKEEQLHAEKEKNRHYITQIRIIGAASAVLLLLLGILILLYRQKQMAYIGLYQQIKEHDRRDVIHHVSTTDNPHQQKIVSRLHQYLIDDHHFAQPNIDRDELVLALATNKTYLFEAIKAITGKTLLEYINHLRLEEARRLLDAHAKLTIEAIAEMSGFNTYRTFQRLFHAQYRMSPAKYRRLAQM